MTDFEERLSALDITVSEDDNNNTFTVFTTVEPLFCFTCNSIEEVRSLIQDTLSSYARTFYQIERVRVRLQSEEIIPIEKLRPSKSFQALLENNNLGEAVSA